MSSRPPFFTSARGRLLMFNLLVVAVTLMVSGVAVLGFRHASQIKEQVQQQTLDDMTGSMNLARDTANVATAAVRLSQVVGSLEYKGEAERLKQMQTALRRSLEQLADAPLAQQEPALVARIIQRSNELQQGVTGMLERGQRRHLERIALLSSLYQSQSYLRHLQDINRRTGSDVPDAQLQYQHRHRRHHRPVEQQAHGVQHHPPQVGRTLADAQPPHGQIRLCPVAAAVETQHRHHTHQSHGAHHRGAGAGWQITVVAGSICLHDLPVGVYRGLAGRLRRHQIQQRACQCRRQHRDEQYAAHRASGRQSRDKLSRTF